MLYLILQEDDGMFAAGMLPEATVYVEESHGYDIRAENTALRM